MSRFVLMVTEMAGGYHLLVPAGLAVMISYLLQVRLSYFLKCQSLCEGQVPTPQDSPAHYMEQIKLALDLLGKRKLQFTNELGHIDLLRLLRSRIGFDLPGGRELTIGIVEQESPLSGKPIKTLYQRLEKYDFEIIAIMRREHVLLPLPDTLMKPAIDLY